MKKAKFYNELTRDKSLLYIIEYENNHPIIMNKIESNIMDAAKNGQYMASIDFEVSMVSSYDIKMIPKVLDYYGFETDWYQNHNISILTIHWA